METSKRIAYICVSQFCAVIGLCIYKWEFPEILVTSSLGLAIAGVGGYLTKSGWENGKLNSSANYIPNYKNKYSNNQGGEW